MSNTPVIQSRLIKARDAARYLATSERTLARLTASGDLPVVRFGRSIRYDIADLDSFISRAKGGCNA